MMITAAPHSCSRTKRKVFSFYQVIAGQSVENIISKFNFLYTDAPAVCVLNF